MTRSDREGVDDAGLDRLDRRFLVAIIEQYRGGPVGLEAIAATINDEAETLAEVVEPFLLKIGYRRAEPERPQGDARGLRPPGLRRAGRRVGQGRSPSDRPMSAPTWRHARTSGRFILGLGVMMVILGGILLLAGNLSGKVPWLGRLPGDIHIQREQLDVLRPAGHLHRPVIVASIVLTLLFSLFGRR